MKTILQAVTGILAVSLLSLLAVHVATRNQVERLESKLVAARAEVKRLTSANEELDLELHRQTKAVEGLKVEIADKDEHIAVLKKYEHTPTTLIGKIDRMVRDMERDYPTYAPAPRPVQWYATPSYQPQSKANEIIANDYNVRWQIENMPRYGESVENMMNRAESQRQHDGLMDVLSQPQEVIIYDGGRIRY